MQRRHTIIVLAALVAIAAGAWVYMVEVRELRASARNTFEVRASLLRQYIRLMRENVYMLERSIEARYAELERNEAFVPELEAIRHYPDYGVWGISGLAREGGLPDLSGTLTGYEVLADPSPPIKRELSAVLGADHQFKTLLEQIPDIIWVYYTSEADFIYIAPDPAIADFRFSVCCETRSFGPRRSRA